VDTAKSSSTLRFLEGHEVFTLEEYLGAVDPAVTERTRYTNLQNAVRRGQAYRAKRGLYASNLGVYRGRVPNVFLLASKAAGDAVVSHHSALEAHGVAHSPLRTVYFTSGQKIGDFEVRGYRFHRVALPEVSDPDATFESYSTRLRAGEALVSVTTRERTLVDCLRDIRLAGGLEELLRSLGGFTSMSTAALTSTVCQFESPTIRARVGWTCEMFQDDWGVDSEFLDAMSQGLGRGTYRLLPHARRQEFVARWRLYVPADLPYADWARG